MAVIVEQEGNPNYKKVKCNCCNSILKYLDVDEQQDNYIDGYFGPETVAYIICPNCGDRVLTWAMCATDFADYRIK